MTHTFVILHVSSAAFQEIRDKLEAAGYDHAIMNHDSEGKPELIDMHGLAITKEPEPDKLEKLDNLY